MHFFRFAFYSFRLQKSAATLRPIKGIRLNWNGDPWIGHKNETEKEKTKII